MKRVDWMVEERGGGGFTVRFWASGPRLIGERAFKWMFRIRFLPFTTIMQ